MLAVIRFQHRSMEGNEIAGLLQACFGMNVPFNLAISRSRRFSAGMNLAPLALHSCNPTSASLAIFFKQNSRTFECILEDSLERGETIYQACQYVVGEIQKSLHVSNGKPKLLELYLEEDNGRRTDISASVATFWGGFRKRLELRDWLFRLANSLLLGAASLAFTELNSLGALFVGLIGLSTTLIISALQSLLDGRGQGLQWKVG